MALRGSPSGLRGAAGRNRGRHRHFHQPARALTCVLPPDGAIGGVRARGHPLPALHKRLETAHPDLLRAGRLTTTNEVFRSSPERFDTVLMINVLEHIADDQASIRAAYHALVPGGTFGVFVPALLCLDSAHARAVRHSRPRH